MFYNMTARFIPQHCSTAIVFKVFSQKGNEGISCYSKHAMNHNSHTFLLPTPASFGPKPHPRHSCQCVVCVQETARGLTFTASTSSQHALLAPSKIPICFKKNTNVIFFFSAVYFVWHYKYSIPVKKKKKWMSGVNTVNQTYLLTKYLGQHELYGFLQSAIRPKILFKKKERNKAQKFLTGQKNWRKAVTTTTKKIHTFKILVRWIM